MPEAAALACANSAALGLPVTVRDGSWFEPLGCSASLCDDRLQPALHRRADPHLDEGTCAFEPCSALVADEQGWRTSALIVAGAPAHLVPGGWLLLEHGWSRGHWCVNSCCSKAATTRWKPCAITVITSE